MCLTGADLIFLSEPKVFSSDIPQLMKYLTSEYCFSLNSGEASHPDLPITNSTAYGGTMVLWKRSIDKTIRLTITSLVVEPTTAMLISFFTLLH